MRESIVPIGLFLIFLGFIIIFIGSLIQTTDSKSNVKVAVGGFIGFLPFGFASDKQAYYILLVFMLLSLIIWFILSKRFL